MCCQIYEGDPGPDMFLNLFGNDMFNGKVSAIIFYADYTEYNNVEF